MIQRSVLVLALSVSTLGCGAAFDAFYFALARHDYHRNERAITRESSNVDATQMISLKSDGSLECSLAVRPRERHTRGTVASHTSNGVRIASAIIAVADGAAIAITTGAREGTCRQPGANCPGNETFYPWLIPVGLDFIWSVVRWITVKPEEFQSLETASSTLSTEESGSRAYTLSSPCPTGGVYVVRAYAPGSVTVTGEITLHFGADGLLDPLLRTPWLRFLHESNGRVALADSQFALDTGPLQAALDAARVAVTPVGIAAAPSQGSMRFPPITLPTGAVVTTPDVPLGFQVHFSASLQPVNACIPSVGCATGLDCKNRGDGVWLCMGPTAGHPFCADPVDCAINATCVHRPGDNIGVCAQPTSTAP